MKKVYRELDEEGAPRMEEEAFRGLDEEERVAFRECEGGIQGAWSEEMAARDGEEGE